MSITKALAVFGAIGLGIGLGYCDQVHAADTPTPLGEIKREPYTADNKPKAVQPTYPSKPKTQPARVTQVQVPCWYVPQGIYTVFQCANGYFVTYMPDGTVVDGNGMPDPNATAQGSTIVINQGTGGPTGQVTGPTQVIPTPAPGQFYYYGFPPPQ
jgi:hypothetical protein